MNLDTNHYKKIKFHDSNKSQFFTTLRNRVDQYFETSKISRNANAKMVIKTILLIGSYIIPFLLIVIVQPDLWVMLLLWVLMGFGLAGVGMSVMHDANHGAYSSNKRINKILGHTLNMIGGSVYNWKMQHNVLHHTYTNVANLDEDIDDKLILRFNPHTKVKKFHRLQYIYAFLLYGILTLYWALAKDFIQFARYTRTGINTGTRLDNIKLVTRMIFDKSLYFIIMLYVPWLAGIPFFYVISGFMLMHFISGVVLTVVFQLAHTVEGTQHPLPGKDGNIENCWAIHQMHTTVNFSHGNKFLTWYLGGLNYQIEHHLFPKICHVHYPAISKIVKSTASEFAIPYLENKTFGKAFRSHLNLLKKLGVNPEINELIG